MHEHNIHTYIQAPTAFSRLTDILGTYMNTYIHTYIHTGATAFAKSLVDSLTDLGTRLDAKITVALRGPEQINSKIDVSLVRVVLVRI